MVASSVINNAQNMTKDELPLLANSIKEISQDIKSDDSIKKNKDLIKANANAIKSLVNPNITDTTNGLEINSKDPVKYQILD